MTDSPIERTHQDLQNPNLPFFFTKIPNIESIGREIISTFHITFSHFSRLRVFVSGFSFFKLFKKFKIIACLKDKITAKTQRVSSCNSTSVDLCTFSVHLCVIPRPRFGYYTEIHRVKIEVH
jgi:hypothetical protein